MISKIKQKREEWEAFLPPPSPYKMNEKQCPYCGSPLPGDASFCPHCAKSVNKRAEVKTPKRIPVAAVRTALVVLAAGCIAGAAFLSSRPKTYSGLGEVIYTDADGTYQFVLNMNSDPYKTMPEVTQDVGEEERYRFPLRLHITHKDSGADAGGTFLQKVVSVESQVIQISDMIVEDMAESMMAEQTDRASADTEDTTTSDTKKSDEVYPVQASTPEPMDFAPESALVSLIDYNRYSPTDTQIVLKLHMENKDTIELKTDLHLTPILTYNYSAETDDLSDTAALQSLIDRIADKIDFRDIVNITLPAVTYTEPLVLHDRAFNLTGSEENGKRTTFTAGIQMRRQENNQWISYLENIDFNGTKDSIGVSTAGRTWVQDCSFTGWKTAVLAFGDTWVNTTDCSFIGNGTGLHFNASSILVNDSRFTGNLFQDNETAVLLESVPSDVTLDFSDTSFVKNATDIANPTQHSVDISNAIFQ